MDHNPPIHTPPAANFLGDAVEIADPREYQERCGVRRLVAGSGHYGHSGKKSENGGQNADIKQAVSDVASEQDHECQGGELGQPFGKANIFKD